MAKQRTVFRTLVRHFSNRLFDSDLVASGGSLRESVVTVVSLLAATSVVVGYVTMIKHWAMGSRTPEAIRSAMEWADREFIMSLSMALVAAVAVLCWQSIFPDTRDCLILSGLPVAASTIIAAKATVLCGVFLLATVSLNFATGFLFPLATAHTMTATEGVQLYSAHIIGVGSASAFVFVAVLAVQALFANILPFRVFQRTSAWIQLVALFGVLFVFFVIPPISSLPAITHPSNRLSALLLPPFWFLGLYQKLLGTSHPFVDELAMRALGALALTTLAAMALYGRAYRRIMLRTIEDSGAVGSGKARRWSWADRVLDRAWFGKKGTERAAFYFVWRTMTRNRGHRLILAAYASVGLVYVVSGIANLVKSRGGDALFAPNIQVSALPLVLPFFVLLGLRALFAIPVELQANWIFRLTDAGRPDEYVRAARKQMLLAGVVPMCLLALPAYGFLWGWRIALAHVTLCVLGSMAVIELLMAGFRKVPFTCPYMPGRGNLKAVFGVYVVLFLALAFLLITIELWVVSSPRRSVIGIAVTAVFLLYAKRRRRERDSHEMGVMWEEPPVWHMQTLELSR